MDETLLEAAPQEVLPEKMNFDVIKPDEIQTMYRQAANKREIVTIMSQLMSCDENEICDILEIPHIQKRAPKHFDGKKALEMLKNGATEKQIAKAFGVSAVYVHTWKLENGLVQRDKEHEKRYIGVRELYEQGMTDPQISENTGLSTQQVYYWRKENGLRANWKPKTKDWSELDKQFRPYFEQGMDDREIAGLCNCNYWTVRDWRKHMGYVHALRSGLAKENKVRRDWDKIGSICRPLYEQGLNDPQIEEKTGINKRDVCEWRKREQLPSQRSLKK